jgi:hypothetical protein
MQIIIATKERLASPAAVKSILMIVSPALQIALTSAIKANTIEIAFIELP